MVYNFELVCGRGGSVALAFLYNVLLNVGNLLLLLGLGCHLTRILHEVVQRKLTFKKGFDNHRNIFI